MSTTHSNDEHNSSSNDNALTSERTALLSPPTHSNPATISYRLRTHFAAPLSTTHADIALLACYLITGLLDSSSIIAWGAFVSMQTGNTVYLGSGVIAPHESTKWLRALISVASFCTGSAASGYFHRTVFDIQQAPKRSEMVVSYSIQLAFLTAAAVLVTVGPEARPSGPVTVWTAVPIALVAFQAAGQAYVSRVVGFGGLTSAVLTSIYLDLFSDQRLFAGVTQNATRNQRAAAPVLLLLGAVMGGLWARSKVGMIGALWMAVALKAVVVLAWAVWREEREVEDSG